MDLLDVLNLPIHEVSDLLRRKELSSVDLTRTTLERIDHVEDRTKAFVTVTKELAMAQATAADARIDSGNSNGCPAGRIASWASWAFWVLVLYVRGSSGRFSGP